MLRHVVMFSWKPGTDSKTIRQIEKAFGALPSKIDVIRDFEWGTDVSVENRAHGFTHCFLVTFEDDAGRDAYLPHPDHQAFSRLVREHMADVLVVDYAAR